MSDFDEVLERLLSDPSFRSALGRDPDTALAGYALDPDERDLLHAQLVSGPGLDHAVEARTTKSGVAGLLGPVAAALGVSAGGVPTGGQSMGSAPSGGAASFGAAASDGTVPGHQDFGSAPGTDSMGSAPGTGATMGSAPADRELAHDYRTWVDVDGDGAWDHNRAYERADGGVDIHVDLNRDGVADFVGHDYDRDGLIDDAEFDDDLDGVMDRRMYDDTGDGWMDRQEPIAGQGPAPAS